MWIFALIFYPSCILFITSLTPIDNFLFGLEINVTIGLALKHIVGEIRPANLLVLADESQFNDDIDELLSSMQPKTPIFVIHVDTETETLFDYQNIQVDDLVLVLGASWTDAFNSTNREALDFRARTRIIFVAPLCSTSEFIYSIFDKAWSVNFLNFLLLVHCQSQIKAFSYFPYNNNECAEDFKSNNVVQLGHFQSAKNETTQFVTDNNRFETDYFQSYLNVDPFYPSKLPFRMPVCSVKVRATKWPPFVIDPDDNIEHGFEIDFLKIVERVTRSQMKWQLTKPLLPDMFSAMQDRSVNIMLGSLYFYPEFIGLDQSYQYFQNNLLWIVPMAKPMSGSKMLWTLITDQYYLFTTLFALVPIIATIVRLALGLQNAFSRKTHFGILSISVFLFRSLVDTSPIRLPRTAWLLKFTFAVWNLCSVIIICYFTTTLTSTLALPDQEYQINGMSDIYESNLRVTVNNVLGPVIVKMPNYGKEIWSRNENMALPNALRSVSLGESASFADHLRSRYIAMLWQNQAGGSTLHFIQDKDISSYQIGLVMNRGHPLFDRVNDFVHRVGNMGFWTCQVKLYFDRMLIRTMVRRMLVIYNYQHGLNNSIAMARVNEALREDEWPLVRKQKYSLQINEAEFLDTFYVPLKRHMLTMNHLVAAFIIICIGNSVSTIVLVGEILWARQHRMRLNQ